MEPFTFITSIAAPLLRINVDTDAIIPSREMKRVSKQGLADGLFAGWRYQNADSREPNPDFILNQPPYDQAKILITGRNFGCGSSREHAVWALKEWGIRVIIAPSFGSIFQLNCIRNGVLAVILDEETIEEMAASLLTDPADSCVTVDLQSQQISMRGREWKFDIPPEDRLMLLEGLDMIALTLKDESVIETFEQADRRRRGWAYL
jgi:3-isopropylmalate/(R)-2-methylmalate dehydratase small subunit